MGELGVLQSELSEWQELAKQAEVFSALNAEEITARTGEAEKLLKQFQTFKIKSLFTGKYDASDVWLQIYAGAGGVDAQDWAGMLLRMYQRYAERNDLSFKITTESLGEQKGIKTAVVEIKGRYAFGYLKGEAGVHRLVRLSPFSAKSLRHTSFALVEILPIIHPDDLQISPSDLKFELSRSSGPGGQNVNKLETAVRVVHLPTGISAAAQSERSQGQNKEQALAMLYARLWQRLQTEHLEEISQLKTKTEPGGVEWGSQIRSYVLHPYKQVKDHRTGVESHNPDTVLDGDLAEFIEAELGDKL